MSPVRTLAMAQLRADLRNPTTGKPGAGRVGLTALAYGFSGLVLALSLGDAPPGDVLLVAGSFGLVLSAFGVVGSFDDLMGRPKDNAWLATLPASEAQHYAARLLGIAGYVLLMAVTVTLPVGLRVAWGAGPLAGLSVGVLMALGVVWVAAVCMAVLWAMTLVLPQRVLRPALSLTRALLVGAIVIGYQWIGTEPGAASAPWWPGRWIADLMGPRGASSMVLLFGSSLVLGVLFGTVFPRRYFRILARLADGARRAESEARTSHGLLAVERLVVRSGPERAAYGFALAAFSDDRLVRGRLWPAALLPLGFVAFGWLAGGLGSLFVYGSMNLLAFEATQLHLSVVIVVLFCVQALVQALQFSDHAEAAWVFGTLPRARPRLLQLGAQRALLLRVLLPLHVGFAVLLALQMPALDALLHALYWFAVAALVSRVQALVYRTPPFSRRSDRFSAGSRMGPLLISIPVGIVVMVVRMGAFTSMGRAAAVSLGVLVLSSAIGLLVERVGRAERRGASTADVPAATMQSAAVAS
jgi:hypothetical protein